VIYLPTDTVIQHTQVSCVIFRFHLFSKGPLMILFSKDERAMGQLSFLLWFLWIYLKPNTVIQHTQVRHRSSNENQNKKIQGPHSAIGRSQHTTCRRDMHTASHTQVISFVSNKFQARTFRDPSRLCLEASGQWLKANCWVTCKDWVSMI
jgi:hypothetical protein